MEQEGGQGEKEYLTFNHYLQRASYVLDSVLGPWDISVNKGEQDYCCDLTF